MSGRLYFDGGPSKGSGFGLTGTSMLYPEDAACVAIGSESEVSHVFLQGSNMHKPVLVGVGCPFIGDRGGRIPYVLKAPIVLTPYVVGTGSYALDLMFYDDVPKVVPMGRGPKFVSGGTATSLGPTWTHGRRSIRYFIDPSTAGSTTVTVTYICRNASLVLPAQSVALSVAASTPTWLLLSSVDPSATVLSQTVGDLIPDLITITLSRAPVYHQIEMFD